MRIRGAHAAGVLFSARWPKTREREKRGLFGGPPNRYTRAACAPQRVTRTRFRLAFYSLI
jgi:hypothetical protein